MRDILYEYLCRCSLGNITLDSCDDDGPVLQAMIAELRRAVGPLERYGLLTHEMKVTIIRHGNRVFPHVQTEPHGYTLIDSSKNT